VSSERTTHFHYTICCPAGLLLRHPSKAETGCVRPQATAIACEIVACWGRVKNADQKYALKMQSWRLPVGSDTSAATKGNGLSVGLSVGWADRKPVDCRITQGQYWGRSQQCARRSLPFHSFLQPRQEGVEP